MSSTVSVQVHRVGFKDYDVGNKSVSTFEFRVEGDYSKVANYYTVLMINPFAPYVVEYITGGQERYTLRYAPENGICYKSSEFDSSYYKIVPLDRFNCFLEGAIQIGRGYRGKFSFREH